MAVMVAVCVNGNGSAFAAAASRLGGLAKLVTYMKSSCTIENLAFLPNS